MRRLVDTYELNPIKVSDGEPLRFRIELFVSEIDGLFSAKVFRWESMRLTPSFDIPGNAPPEADYTVLVEDDSLGVVELHGNSPDEVLKAVLARISEAIERLGHPRFPSISMWTSRRPNWPFRSDRNSREEPTRPGARGA
jgi:hypothetical protein